MYIHLVKHFDKYHRFFVFMKIFAIQNEKFLKKLTEYRYKKNNIIWATKLKYKSLHST